MPPSAFDVKRVIIATETLECSMGKGHYLGGSTTIKTWAQSSCQKRRRAVPKVGYLSKLAEEARLQNRQTSTTHPDTSTSRRRPNGQDIAPKTKPKSTKNQESLPQYTQEFEKHFEYGTRTRESQKRLLAPLLKACALNGIKRDRDIAIVLNKSGYRTACGDKWTPLLVHFLRKFWTERPRIERRSPLAARAKLENRTQPPNASNQITTEDLATRLSRLGRVTKSG